MEKNTPIHLQELIFGSSNPGESRQIAAWLAAGQVKKIAPRIYTGKIDEAPEVIVRRNIFDILGHHYKNAVLSHRSALEFAPTTSGTLFLTYTYTRKIELPGITLRIQEGKGPLADDTRFKGNLYVSHSARAYLENLQVTRKSGPDTKSLGQRKVEEKLEKMITVYGEAALNQLRDQARKISPALDMEKEFEQLNKIISALLSTYPSAMLISGAGKFRASGEPFDGGRVELFEKLFAALQQTEVVKRPDRNNTKRAFDNTAFFESYFSNYIEGTIFEVEEALQIIQTQKPIPARDEDSHDILATYQLVSNRTEMNITPGSAAQLIDIMQYRHKVLLSARPNKQPGAFKDRNNRAGETMFVDYRFVKGTLKKGFEYYAALTSPFAKAVFMMFMISEVHPFLDGNGRLARIMMNAELVKDGEAKIIIPTVYRIDYLTALRRLTRHGDPAVFIKMMQRAHEFSENIYGEDRDALQAWLITCNAFSDDSNTILRFGYRG